MDRIEFIRQNKDKLNSLEMGAQLGLSASHIRSLARFNGIQLVKTANRRSSKTNKHIEAIREGAGKLTAKEIGESVGLAAQTVRQIANRNGIKIRRDAETYISKNCPNCGNNVYYKSCSACVHCKKQANRYRYNDPANQWLMRSWA